MTDSELIDKLVDIENNKSNWFWEMLTEDFRFSNH